MIGKAYNADQVTGRRNTPGHAHLFRRGGPGLSNAVPPSPVRLRQLRSGLRQLGGPARPRGRRSGKAAGDAPTTLDERLLEEAVQHVGNHERTGEYTCERDCAGDLALEWDAIDHLVDGADCERVEQVHGV